MENNMSLIVGLGAFMLLTIGSIIFVRHRQKQTENTKTS